MSTEQRAAYRKESERLSDRERLRDQIAIAAMQAFVSTYPNGSAAGFNEIAMDSYELADVMLQARDES